MVRRNQPRRARPRHLGDRALRDWLLQRRAEGWEGLDDEEDVEDEDFVGDEVAVEGAVAVENVAGEEVGIVDGDFAVGDWEDDNVVPLDLIEDLQQQEEEQAAALADEVPPRTGKSRVLLLSIFVVCRPLSLGLLWQSLRPRFLWRSVGVAGVTSVCGFRFSEYSPLFFSASMASRCRWRG